MPTIKTAIASVILESVGEVLPLLVPKIMTALGIGKYRTLADRVFDAVNEEVVKSSSPIVRSQVYQLIKIGVETYTYQKLPAEVQDLLTGYLAKKFDFEKAIEEQAAKIPEEQLKQNLDTAIASFKEKQASALLGTKPASLG